MKKIDNSKLEQLSKRELIEYIKKLDQTNDFGLVWESHEEDIVNNLQKKLPILTEVKKNKIQNDKNNSSNIIIEGDNYDSLFKFIIIGNPSTGKTCILHSFLEGKCIFF